MGRRAMAALQTAQKAGTESVKRNLRNGKQGRDCLPSFQPNP
jgi:hypothetical protein